MTEVAGLLSGNGVASCWVGAGDPYGGNNFKWMHTDNPVSASLWGPSEPNYPAGYCAHLAYDGSSSYALSVGDCVSSRYFICELD